MPKDQADKIGMEGETFIGKSQTSQEKEKIVVNVLSSLCLGAE